MRYDHGTHEHYSFDNNNTCAVCGVTFGTVSTHEFSSHSNRPWECRMCHVNRTEHSTPAIVAPVESAPIKLRWQGPINAPAVLVPRMRPYEVIKAVDYDDFCLDSHGGYGACVRVTGHTGAHRDQLGFGWTRPLASRMAPVQVAPVYTLAWENGLSMAARVPMSGRSESFATIDRLMRNADYPESIAVVLYCDGVPYWSQHGTRVINVN